MKTQERREVNSKNRFHSALPGEHLVSYMQHLLPRQPEETANAASTSSSSTRRRANIPFASSSRPHSSDIVDPPPRPIGGMKNQTRRDYSKWYDQYDTDKPNKSIAD
jgi:hypothetical protein